MAEKNPHIANIENHEEQISITSDYLFSDIQYICQSVTLITEATQQGFDVAQLPNGDIMITEVKVVNVHYSWNATKQKFVKVNI